MTALPLWNGRILWRGITESDAFLSGRTMIMAGHEILKFVCYPISNTPFRNGKFQINSCAADGKEWAKGGELVGTIYESTGGTPFVALVGPGDHKFPAADAPKLIVKFFKEHEKK